MQLDAVHDRTHSVFADAGAAPAVGITGEQPGLPVDRQELGGSPSRVMLLDSARSASRPTAQASWVKSRSAPFQRPHEWQCLWDRQTSWVEHLQPGLSSFLISRSCNCLRSVCAAALVVGLLPLPLNLRTALDQLASVRDHFIGNLEGLGRVEAQHLLGSGNFLVATAPCALPVPWSLGVKPDDDRVQADKARRSVGLGRFEPRPASDIFPGSDRHHHGSSPLSAHASRAA